MGFAENKSRHESLNLIGLRAHATAVGLIQLCIELQRVGVLPKDGVDRIKQAIADDLVLATPRSLSSTAFRTSIEHRLDRLFAGEEQVGTAEAGLSEVAQAQH